MNLMMQSVAAIARRRANAGNSFVDFRTGLAAEWDAENIAGANNDPVSSWPETVAAADADNATGGQQPLLKTAALNGKNFVQFNGTTDFLTSTYVEALGDFTLVAVFRQDSTPVTYAALMEKGYVANTWVGWVTDSGGSFGAGCTQGSGPFVTSIAISNSTWYVLTARRSGTSWTVRLNWNLATASDTVASTAMSSDALVFGKTPFSGFYPGSLAQFRVYNDDLNDTDLRNVVDFLGSEYNITITP